MDMTYLLGCSRRARRGMHTKWVRTNTKHLLILLFQRVLQVLKGFMRPSCCSSDGCGDTGSISKQDSQGSQLASLSPKHRRVGEACEDSLLKLLVVFSEGPRTDLSHLEKALHRLLEGLPARSATKRFAVAFKKDPDRGPTCKLKAQQHLRLLDSSSFAAGTSGVRSGAASSWRCSIRRLQSGACL